MDRVDLDLVNEELKQASAVEVLQWAMNTFGERIAATSSFQTQSVPLLHLISQTVPQMPVLFIDTGFHFGDTLAFRDSLQKQLKLNIVPVRPKRLVQRDRQGRPLYSSDPDLCCYHHKVAPLDAALKQYDALISGVRGDQTAHRASLQTIERDKKGHFRIHPLLKWTKRELWAYVDEFNLPAHPLFSEGYLSIGCKPCTRPVFEGEDERAGRWAGQQKTECGLHTQLSIDGDKNRG